VVAAAVVAVVVSAKNPEKRPAVLATGEPHDTSSSAFHSRTEMLSVNLGLRRGTREVKHHTMPGIQTGSITQTGDQKATLAQTLRYPGHRKAACSLV
jgi:hypothetical protein